MGSATLGGNVNQVPVPVNDPAVAAVLADCPVPAIADRASKTRAQKAVLEELARLNCYQEPIGDHYDLKERLKLYHLEQEFLAAIKTGDVSRFGSDEGRTAGFIRNELSTATSEMGPEGLAREQTAIAVAYLKRVRELREADPSAVPPTSSTLSPKDAAELFRMAAAQVGVPPSRARPAVEALNDLRTGKTDGLPAATAADLHSLALVLADGQDLKGTVSGRSPAWTRAAGTVLATDLIRISRGQPLIPVGQSPSR